MLLKYRQCNREIFQKIWKLHIFDDGGTEYTEKWFDISVIKRRQIWNVIKNIEDAKRNYLKKQNCIFLMMEQGNYTKYAEKWPLGTSVIKRKINSKC